MSKFTVTVLDTTGIQKYIFRSNKLRENIGASYLVSQVTTTWVRDTLRQLSQEINQEVQVFDPKEYKAEDKPYIEDGNLAAELVYAGGGNTVLLFSQWECAKEFTRILSKRVLINAPGINLVVAHKPDFDWHKDSLYQVVQNLMTNDLEAKKNNFVPSSPLLGLGVTAACRSTQLVAVDKSKKYEDEEPYLISREIRHKLDAIPEANKRLKADLLTTDNRKGYDFPMRTDFLGRSQGESSYVAVIHADGNGIGERFQKCGEGKENREYITAMRKLSHSVNQAGVNALQTVIDVLITAMPRLKEKLDLKEDKLPFRPLVYGGDDATFVCEGRLGLELAALYLETLQKQPIADNQPLKACAGIAIVKTHYPFVRAYELSESLCREAKMYVKDKKKKEDDFSALDWHFAASGLSGSLSEIRDREYRVEAVKLEMRPVRLEKDDDDWRSWEGFRKVVQDFNREGSYWQQRRNKVIQLREVLRQGPEKTKDFLKAYRLETLPEFLESSGKKETLAEGGWLDGVCGYFDAIEAMDYLELGEAKSESVSTEN